MENKCRDKIEGIQKTNHSWWKRVAYPAQKLGYYAKHIYMEHKQNTDHDANWGAETVKNAETWEAVPWFWDGSNKL